MSVATGGNSRTETSVLFGSKAPREANFCRRLEHETGRWERARPWLPRRGRRSVWHAGLASLASTAVRSHPSTVAKCAAAAPAPSAPSFPVTLASLTSPPGGATRDVAMTVNQVLSGQVSRAVLRFDPNFDASVIDQPGGKWYAREIRASTQPMGTQ